MFDLLLDYDRFLIAERVVLFPLRLKLTLQPLQNSHDFKNHLNFAVL